MSITNYISEHPYLTGGIAIGGIVGVLILKSTLAPAAQPTPSSSYGYGISPQEAQLAAVSEQTNAQLTGQSNQIAAQEQLAGLQAQYGVDIAQINANTSVTNTNTGAQVSLAQIAASESVSNNSIAAQLGGVEDNNATQLQETTVNDATSVDIGTLLANENTAIAATNAKLQSNIAGDQTQVALAQTDAAVSIAQSNNSTGLLGGIVGAVASFL
jgi:hypothetical protein